MQNHFDQTNSYELETDYKQILHDVRIQMHTISSALQVMGRYTESRVLLASGMDITYFHEIISEAVIKGIDLLDVALPARGVRAVDEPFCAVAMTRGIIKGLSVLAESMNDTLMYKGPERCVLPGGKSKAERILYNLLTNAITHTPEGTCIVVELEKREGEIRLSVTDGGKGLSPEQAEVLCGPLPFPEHTETFYGLRSIRGLTGELGGHITVEKNTDNGGNSVSIFIPCAECLAQIQKIRHNTP